MIKSPEPVALIDMDGTVVDFDGQMTRDLAALASPAENLIKSGPDDSNEPQWLVARKKLIKSVPGWWENLPIHPPGRDIVEELRQQKFDLMVLTKGPYNAAHAWSEKVTWCRKNLPFAAVTITEDKGLVYGKVLVDDWPTYGIRWLEWRPRGLLVVPAWPWNRLDQYPAHLHDNIFRYTGVEDMAALRLRLEVARQTAA